LTAAQSGDNAPERDIVVVGGSAGSLDPLREIVGRLRADSPIAMFVVVHVLPTGQSRLPLILSRAGRLPVRHAHRGDRIERGRVLVAPPDRHLLLDPSGVRLDHGPRENSTRPAVDPLFRGAAATFGPRVCGAVLSGNLDDGSEGLRLIAAASGLALVQDPEEAPHAEMPLNALWRVPSAEVLTAAGIGRRLAGLPGAASAAVAPAADSPSAPPVLDTQVDDRDAGGAPSGITCPECGGVLWSDANIENLHCPVGHRYSVEALWDHKSLAVEQSVWSALRALQEDASLAEHMAARARAHGNTHTAARFERRHREAIRHSELLRRLIQEHEPPD
jgi:two-component system, chemotaxis family, protein-glutamate methylesterase/glutaminase